jgi:hypothetical protein
MKIISTGSAEEKHRIPSDFFKGKGEEVTNNFIHIPETTINSGKESRSTDTCDSVTLNSPDYPEISEITILPGINGKILTV